MEIGQDELTRAIREMRTAAAYFTSPAFVARVEQTHLQAAREDLSPWISREAAAARWFKTESSIDRAAAAGILKIHKAGGTTLFDKHAGDDAIRAGVWTV